MSTKTPIKRQTMQAYVKDPPNNIVNINQQGRPGTLFLFLRRKGTKDKHVTASTDQAKNPSTHVRYPTHTQAECDKTSPYMESLETTDLSAKDQGLVTLA